MSCIRSTVTIFDRKIPMVHFSSFRANLDMKVKRYTISLRRAHWAFADLDLKCIYCAVTCPKISGTKGLCERWHMSHVHRDWISNFEKRLRFCASVQKQISSYVPSIFLPDILRGTSYIVCCIHVFLITHVSLSSPFPVPSHLLFLCPSHTDTDNPPSSSYGMSKMVWYVKNMCVCPTQWGGGGLQPRSLNEWQDLPCSSLTPVRASSAICV